MRRAIYNAIGNKAVMPVILTLAITATLILIPTGQASALSMDITKPSPKTLGEVITFSATVQIEDSELLPIQSVDLEIYKQDDPATYNLVCTNLPLTSGSKTYSTTGGTVEVGAVPEPSLAYSYGYRNAEWQGYGYSWGYGYGYGYQPGIGTTSINYNVLWNSLSTWPGGIYEVKLTVYANGDSFGEISAIKLTAGVVYVDIDNVAGPWDGTSWATAYQTIQEGLDDAYLAYKEVWVAAGTYKPTSTTDRSVSFQLKPGVALYGGFDGTETVREQRDWATNVTILSGDIGTPDDNNDNSYHVAVGADDATIDGFTITVGNANGTDENRYGGGMYNSNVSPTVANCIFYSNLADSSGGGMYNSESSPTVANCVFSGNWAWFGGGMYNNESSPMVTYCTFANNTVAGSGGGMYNYFSSPTVINCIFSDNYGGGMYNYLSSPKVTNCIFSKNSYSFGGGISNWSSSPVVTNCTFTGNSATWGGGIRNARSSAMVTNCIFSANSALYGGGVENWKSSAPMVTNCTFTGNSATYGGGISNYDSSPVVTNCILWANGEEIYSWGSSVPKLTYCDVQGGYSGVTNINTNPMFVDPATYNYHLQGGSLCIDKGTNTGAPTEDIEGNPRPIDGDGIPGAVTDMGAYEYVPPSEVWVDDNYTPGGYNDGHTWGYDAFASIQDGIDAVGGSIVHVAAGIYAESITMKTGITLQGAGATLVSIVGDKVDCRNSIDFVIERFTIDGGIDCPGDTGLVSGIIRNNIITSDGSGIGATWNVNLEIINNLIINNRNTENTDGAGIAVMYSDAYARIINNTIVGNYHGIWAFKSNVVVQSNIVAFNSGGQPQNPSTGIDHHGSIGSIQISYNDVYGNDVDYRENASPGVGDISGDPLFVDLPGGDYRLQAGSPCIDVGTDTGAPTEDIEGNPRPIDGDVIPGAVTDMGAYEFVPPAPVADFSGNPTAGEVPLTVDFTDVSSSIITSWSWEFGDTGTSDVQNPSHTYNTAGVYTVSLTVTGPGGIDTETKTDYITVNPALAVEATVNFAPDTLNKKSKGKWVTAYIELETGYDVNDIDIGTVRLNGSVAAESKPITIGDYDSDGVPDLMVKFDRALVQELLTAGNEVEITVSGELTDDTPFEGTDTIRVKE